LRKEDGENRKKKREGNEAEEGERGTEKGGREHGVRGSADRGVKKEGRSRRKPRRYFPFTAGPEKKSLAPPGSAAETGLALGEGSVGHSVDCECEKETVENRVWRLGATKRPRSGLEEKRMAHRGWTPDQITEAIQGGQQFPAANNIVPRMAPRATFTRPPVDRSS